MMFSWVNKALEQVLRKKHKDSVKEYRDLAIQPLWDVYKPINYEGHPLGPRNVYQKGTWLRDVDTT